jgi:hypothetical protein
MFWWYRAHDNRNFPRIRKNNRAREGQGLNTKSVLTKDAFIGFIHSVEVMPVYSGTQAFWYNRWTLIGPLGFESRSLFWAKLQKSKLALTLSLISATEKNCKDSGECFPNYNVHLCIALIHIHFLCLHKFWL